MEQEPASSVVKPARMPWNKGKLVGAKPPLRPSHVWSIRTKLQIEGKKRDLALFNLAIDSKLRGCDVVAVRVDDVAPSGYSMDRATIRQKKTGRPVRFELTDQTRQAVDEYLRLTGRKPGQFLFAGRGDRGGLTTRQYARLVQEWVASIGLDPAKFGTHSLRRTKAVLIYRRTGNLRAVQLLRRRHLRRRLPISGGPLLGLKRGCPGFYASGSLEARMSRVRKRPATNPAAGGSGLLSGSGLSRASRCSCVQ